MQVPSRRRIVGAEYLHVRALAERRLAGDLDEVGRARCRLAGAALGVGAGDVEIAQRDVAQVVGAGRVGQHQLGHELRGAVGRDGTHFRVVGDRCLLWIAVDGRSGREDEVTDTGRHRDLDEGPRLHRVVEIVAERIDDRVGDDDRAREMHDGVDAVLAHDGAREILVAHVADDERRLRRHGPPEPRGQIVENHDLFAGLDEFENHVAADIAGAARNQDSHFDHFPNCAPRSMVTISSGLMTAEVNPVHLIINRQMTIKSRARVPEAVGQSLWEPSCRN